MPELPRLVQVAEFDRPHSGSFVPLLSGLLKAAGENGWRPMAVLPESAGETAWIDEVKSVADLRLAPRSVLGSRHTRARWLAEEIGPSDAHTVLHSHFTSWDVPALMSSRGRRDSTSVFWHIHSALPRNPFIVARSSFKFGVLGRATAGIICPAPNIALGVEQRLGPRGRVHFVPSALDPALYPLASPSDRAAARAELEIPDEAQVLLHFGWHPYLKGTDIFLEVVRDLMADDDRLFVLVRGHEPESEQMARELGIESRVRFQAPVPEASSLFAAADIVVSSSREEGMAYTVLEALSTGTPVVATAIPGHAYIGEQVEACHITSIDKPALSSSIKRVLELDPQVRLQQGEAAHQWIVSNLSVGAISAQLLDLYERELPDGERRVSAMRHPAATRVSTPRVIQAADFSNPEGGSFVPMLAAVSRAVADRGWAPEVVLPESAAGCSWLASLEAAGAKVRFAPSVGRDGTRRWLRDLVEASAGPCVIHTHFTGFDIAATEATRGNDSAHVIWHVHSALNSSSQIVLRNLVKFGPLGRSVAAIVCPAPDMPKALMRRGARSSRLRFVPNGIDRSRFVPASEEERAAAREDLGLPSNSNVVLGFGWDWEIKSGDLFLRGAHAAAEVTQGVHAVLLTKDERGALLRAELEMDDHVTLLGPQDDVRPLYAAADVFVAASPAEGIPLAVLEALASGVPVVASDIPAHRFIAERTKGVTLAARDPKAMGDAISRVIQDGESNETDLPEAFSLSRWSAEMMRIYEGLV